AANITVLAPPSLRDLLEPFLFITSHPNAVGKTVKFMFLAKGSISNLNATLIFGDSHEAAMIQCDGRVHLRYGLESFSSGNIFWLHRIEQFETKFIQTHSYWTSGNYTITLRISAEFD